MKQPITMKNNQGGFSLIELMIVIAIIMTMIAALLVVYQNIQDGNRLKDATQQVTMSVQKVRGYFRNQGAYTGLTNAVVVNARLFQDDMLIGGNLLNPWRGAYTFASNAAGIAAANDSFSLTIAGVPQDACSQLVSNVERGFAQITVNGTVVKAVNGNLNLATTANQCANAANTIVLIGI